jgi:hypothetical protein
MHTIGAISPLRSLNWVAPCHLFRSAVCGAICGMPEIRIDESRYPLVLVTYDGIVSDDQFREHLAQMDRMLTSGREPNVIVVDARKAGVTPPTQRKMQADWQAVNHDAIAERSLGTVFVLDSAPLRGVLTAILWLSPLPNAHAVVATKDEAWTWAEQKLRESVRERPRSSSIRPFG